MNCLDTNNICPEGNKKCKECKLDFCQYTLKILEDEMKKKDDRRKTLIKAQLPEQCKNCSFLKVIDLNKQIVRCPYMIKSECLIRR